MDEVTTSRTTSVDNSMPIKKGGVFALGNFDGVHLGHQAVIRAAIEKARGLGVPARVLTLEPHPRSVLKPHVAPFRLTPEPAKDRYLRALGVDDVVVQRFDENFARLTAAEFMQRFLVEEFGAHHVVAGFDFVFGHQRGGNMKLLRDGLADVGVGVTEVTPFRDKEGEILSSSRTREALQKGDLTTAKRILGRPWTISGTIEHGSQRGTQISIPTANISLGEYLRPLYGVYAVRASRVGSDLLHQGVANIGLRPTVDGKTEMLEAHLFEFDETIYGQSWEVELVDFIRPEQTFSGLDALRDQIMLDIEVARSRLATAL